MTDLIPASQKLSPVIPDGVMRAEGEQRSDPGPREFDSWMEIPDSLAALGFRDEGWKDALEHLAWRLFGEAHRRFAPRLGGGLNS